MFHLLPSSVSRVAIVCAATVLPAIAFAQTAGGLHLVQDKGGRLDWLPTAPFLVTFDALSPSGVHEVYTMKPDGSAPRCLTCQAQGLPDGLSRGNPAWHPSGKFVLFQAAHPNQFTGTPKAFFTDPGQGIFNDLWITGADGRRYWKMASTTPRGGGVLHAHFSPDGTKVLWTERLGPGPTRFGTWALRVGDFDPSGPRVSNVKNYRPLGEGVYESHGFTPDGSGIIFTGSNPPAVFGNTNIYTLDLRSSKLVNLTNMSHEWNEHAHCSHDGKHIIWASSLNNKNAVRNASGDVQGAGHELDLWMMNPDGSQRRRLTNINTPGSTAYDPGLGGASDGDWSPDDKQYMFYLIRPGRRAGRMSSVDGQIWVLDLQ